MFSLDEGLETNDGQLYQQIPDHSPLPDEIAESNETAILVREEIACLPTYLRDILILRDLENYTYQELAIFLNLSEGTVKSRLSRARKQLMNRLLKREQKLTAMRLTDKKSTLNRKGGAG